MSENWLKISSKIRAQLCAHIFQWLVGWTLKNHTFSFWCDFVFLDLTSTPVDFCKLARTFSRFFGDFCKTLGERASTFGGGDYRGGGSLIPTNKGYMILDVRYSVCRTSKINVKSM